MLRRHTLALASLAISTLLAAGTAIGTALARDASRPRQDNVAMGTEEITRVLPLIEQDKNGKISKQAFMSYMEAEFERLDKDKTGALDVKELTQSGLRVSRAAHPSR
jgi:hypothetical protein